MVEEVPAPSLFINFFLSLSPPPFQILPYWGNVKDRQILRKFWNQKQLYGRDAPLHVLITSYQLLRVRYVFVSKPTRSEWAFSVLILMTCLFSLDRHRSAILSAGQVA